MRDIGERSVAERPERIIVAMLGARRHYAIPRMLYRAGKLEHFYTDIVATQGLPRVLKMLPRRLQSAPIRRLAGRVPVGLPEEKISSFPLFGLMNALRLARTRNLEDQLNVFEWGAKEFSRLVLARGFRDGDAVYTFDRCGLEIMQAARERGMAAIMEQTVAPFRINQTVLNDELSRFPDWEESSAADEASCERFSAREEAEWSMADAIICGSEYVKSGIEACGGPVERCVVVPYGVDERLALLPRTPHAGPLRVLSVGAVGLRKGAPYILEAAKRLRGQVQFRMVGPLHVSPAMVEGLGEHVELIGQVPRAEIAKHYQWADVFLLPSLVEGSAGAIYEALSSGLPVICTPNAGSVVRDGVDGFLVPIRDTSAIVDALVFLAKNPDALAKMASRVAARRKYCSLEAYQARLVHSLDTLRF